MGRFSELMAEEKKRRFSELLAQEQAGSTDPDVPVARPAKQPAVQTKLASAPLADRLKLGLKANPQDRLKGAQELYPDSVVEQINDGSVVVRRPSGEVYNFEEPNLGQALTGIARRVVGLDSEIRGAENPTTARALDENASAALPELVLRGVPSAAAAALTGGAGLLPHVLTQAAAGAASEIPRAGINAVTAGGESRSSAEIREDAQREGLLAGAGTAVLGLAAKPFRSAADSIAARFGSKGAAARDITKQLGGTSEGSPQLRQILDDVDNLGVPRDKAPLSIVERANPKAGPRLKEIYSDPKVADEAAFLEREGQDAVRNAGEQAIRDAKAGVRYDAEFARKSRNLALKEIRQADPALDAELEVAKPRNIKTILEKRLPPDDPGVEKLNASWKELDQARLQLKAGSDIPEIAGPKATMRAVKESGRRVKPNKPKEMLLSAPARLGVRTAVGLGTAGLSEIPGLAAKFARFARGDKIGRKLITSPEVKNEVLRMLADGIPEKEISAWLVSAAAQAGENIE